MRAHVRNHRVRHIDVGGPLSLHPRDGAVHEESGRQRPRARGQQCERPLLGIHTRPA